MNWGLLFCASMAVAMATTPLQAAAASGEPPRKLLIARPVLGFTRKSKAAVAVLSLLLPLMAVVVLHRLYLLRRKRALLVAPSWLNWLLPQPVDYEEQMSQLCKRYLDASPV